jgi:hypothetical protein
MRKENEELKKHRQRNARLRAERDRLLEALRRARHILKAYADAAAVREIDDAIAGVEGDGADTERGE